MKSTLSIILLLLLKFFFTGDSIMPQIKNENNNGIKEVIITIIYDNNSMLEGLKTGWGFACLVEFEKTKMLFDTGDDGNILLSNMAKLNIDPGTIDLVFLSHFHHDHTGGLIDFLKKNSKVKVYYPQSFPDKLVKAVTNSGASAAPIISFQELQTNIFSLGELGDAIPEQSLAIKTVKGIIVITGCAHPGIINILEKAKSSFPGEPIYLALGGFHLHKRTESELRGIVNEILKIGIINAAPSHCSGDAARSIFKEVYCNSCFEIGTGKVIIIK
jgi:7,8-dihydropterin-6-yl-methyl-4-(beta-D-ribofuranosyl)aminobenzene 5'-phosphate synthase